jgi:Spy/CpxP family protein refolding chaperone
MSHVRLRRARSRRAILGALARAVVIAAMVSPACLAAQVGSQGRPGGQDREQIERRIRAQMGRMMEERLALDETQAASLSEVVQTYETRRRELFTQEQATRRRVQAVLLEGGANQAEARTLLDRMAGLQRQEAELFVDEQEAFLDILTPTQVLQLHELRQDLGRRIRALGPPPQRRR